MNTPDSITERLNAQSDEALREQINRDFDPVWKLLGCGGEPLTFTTKEAIGNYKPVQVFARESFRAMKELAFDFNKEHCRSKTISEFMAKVESIEQQISELRDSIPQE